LKSEEAAALSETETGEAVEIHPPVAAAEAVEAI
jgi:hypothetical protein